MRELARRIVRMRRLLALAIVHELALRAEAQRATLALLDAESKMLPLYFQRAQELDRRVGAPVKRKIMREGILAQQNVAGTL